LKRVTIVDNTIRGKMKDGQEFSLVTPNDPTLINTLREKKIDIKAEATAATTLVDDVVVVVVAHAAVDWRLVLHHATDAGRWQ